MEFSTTEPRRSSATWIDTSWGADPAPCNVSPSSCCYWLLHANFWYTHTGKRKPCTGFSTYGGWLQGRLSHQSPKAVENTHFISMNSAMNFLRSCIPPTVPRWPSTTLLVGPVMERGVVMLESVFQGRIVTFFFPFPILEVVSNAYNDAPSRLPVVNCLKWLISLLSFKSQAWVIFPAFCWICGTSFTDSGTNRPLKNSSMGPIRILHILCVRSPETDG